MNLPFDFQLVTPRCRLRCPNTADTTHVFSASRFSGFNDGMLWDPPASELELLEFLEQTQEAWRRGEGFDFSIDALRDGAFLGRIGIRTTLQLRVWNLGFWLHPAHQGKGYMAEAARAIVDFGFERLEADAIEACHATWNVRSRRVLEVLGMVEVEYLPHGFRKRGEWVAEYRMRVTRGSRLAGDAKDQSSR